jgi:hypothetical protein
MLETALSTSPKRTVADSIWTCEKALQVGTALCFARSRRNLSVSAGARDVPLHLTSLPEKHVAVYHISYEVCCVEVRWLFIPYDAFLLFVDLIIEHSNGCYVLQVVYEQELPVLIDIYCTVVFEHNGRQHLYAFLHVRENLLSFFWKQFCLWNKSLCILLFLSVDCSQDCGNWLRLNLKNLLVVRSLLVN